MPRRPSIERKQEKRSWGGVFAMLIVLLMIAGVIYAIVSGGSRGASGAGDILGQAKIATSSLTTESFTFEGVLEADSPGGFLSMGVSGEGRIDSQDERMYFKVNMESPVSETGPTGPGTSLESYAIGDQLYTKFAGGWATYAGTGKLWGDSHFSQKLVTFAQRFESGLEEKEVVNGRKCYKVIINPTMGELMDLLAEMDPGILENAGVTYLGSFGGGVRSMEIVMWIDEFEYLPVRADFLMEATTQMINPAGSGVVPVEIVLSVEVNFDHKTPFNIVLPADAKDAVEI